LDTASKNFHGLGAGCAWSPIERRDAVRELAHWIWERGLELGIPAASVDHLLRHYGTEAAGIFNLGGDLDLFGRLITAGDRAGLRHYAHVCVEGQYRRAVGLDLPVHTICLVQGDALGGGFEAALSHDVIVAERGTRFGLPVTSRRSVGKRFQRTPRFDDFGELVQRYDPQGRFLGGRPHTTATLLVATYRDVEARLTPGLGDLFAFVRMRAHSHTVVANGQ
jgi:hypothetical protein